MSIDQERLNAFQARMNGWVSSQGLLFQLRHGGAVHGAKSPFMAAVLRLLLRGGLVAVVVLFGFWFYLAKRVDYGGFRDGLGEGITQVLGAREVEMSGVERERGFLNLNQMSIEGGEESFFYAAEMRGVRTQMGLLDGVLTPWAVNELTMKELRVKVKSGAESDEAAATAFASVFNSAKGFQFSSLKVEKATVFWGYSKMHRGGIRDARMVAEREGDGWKVVFTGGQFSQNWLKNLDIERLVVNVTKEGVTIPEMKLSLEEGTVHCNLEFVAGGARPEIKGAGSMSGVPIWGLLKPEFRDFIAGQFSGTFEIGGSMNSQDGIELAVDVKLEEGDKIELRDRFPLFVAVSAADRFRSYKRVRFTSGQFQIRSGGGEMEVDDIWLSAPELMRLEGAFHARPPTKDEVKALLNFEEGATVGGLPLSGGDAGDDEGDEFSLGRAGKLSKDTDEPNETRSIILSREFGIRSTQELENDAMLRQQQSHQLIGELRVGLTKDTFARSPSLESRYAVGEDGMRWITVPMKGNIFTVGVKEADILYQRRREER